MIEAFGIFVGATAAGAAIIGGVFLVYERTGRWSASLQRSWQDSWWEE